MIERGNTKSGQVPVETYEFAVDMLTVYKHTLRDLLSQSGIDHDISSSDNEIFESVSRLLGAENKYQKILESMRKKRSKTYFSNAK